MRFGGFIEKYRLGLLMSLERDRGCANRLLYRIGFTEMGHGANFILFFFLITNFVIIHLFFIFCILFDYFLKKSYFLYFCKIFINKIET